MIWGKEGDQRHGVLLCEKWGCVSPSIPASAWRGYFLSLKAVCIFDHRTHFLPISSHTHIRNSISSSCNMLDPVTSATQFALPLPSLSGTQTCKLTSIQQELGVANSSALTSFQALFSNPAEFTWIHLSTQLQSQCKMKNQTCYLLTVVSAGDDNTDLQACKPSSLPIHSHRLGPQKTFHTVTSNSCSLHSLGRSHIKVLKDSWSVFWAGLEAQDLPSSS